ncbi:hypothetical protein KA082_01730 [Candidatus Woesebacteria bacterium]|nr:hypothetical protein [Candidatus Woesebacteria bacterium]
MNAHLSKVPAQNSRIYTFFSLIGVVCVVVAYFLVLGSPITHISCTLDSHECPIEIMNKIAGSEGKRLLGEDHLSRISAELGEHAVTIVSLKKQLPNQLVVVLESQPPAYRLKTKDTEVVVGEKGNIFTPSQRSQELTITTQQSLSEFTASNTTILPEIHTALFALCSAIQKAGLQVKTINWVDKDTIILIMNTEQLQAIVDLQHAAVQVKTLQTLLTSRERAALPKPITEIDLRFKFPVLRTAQ